MTWSQIRRERAHAAGLVKPSRIAREMWAYLFPGRTGCFLHSLWIRRRMSFFTPARSLGGFGGGEYFSLHDRRCRSSRNAR
jgi:hypothetical protein